VVRVIFILKRDNGAHYWRILHDEGFDNLYSSPNIIKLISSRRLNLTGHVAQVRNTRNEAKVKSENQKAKDCLADTGVCRLTMVKLILTKR
jgi:adenine specific DNA methylase Mod